MSILRRLIYLIIFSDWNDLMIAHSIGLCLETVKRYRQIVNVHRNSLNDIINMDDRDLAILIGDALDRQEQESMAVWQNDALQHEYQRGYVYE